MKNHEPTHDHACPPHERERSERARPRSGRAAVLGGHRRGAHRAARRWGAALLFVSSSGALFPASASAGELFEKGVKAMDASKWEECRAALLAAWSIHRSYQIAGNLAECETKLGRWADAAAHLTFFLREMPPTAPAERKARGQELLREVRPKVAELTVRVNKPDAEVLVDGKAVGRSPLADAVFVEPGDHALEAKLGGAAAKASVSAKGGGAQEVTLAFEEAKGPPARSMVPAYVMGGVGLASAIVGGVLVGSSVSTQADMLADVPVGPDGRPACRRAPEPATNVTAECEAWRVRGSEASMLGNVGIGLFVVAGVAAAGALGYALWPSGSGSRSGTTWRVSPVVSVNGAGTILEGRF